MSENNMVAVAVEPTEAMIDAATHCQMHMRTKGASFSEMAAAVWATMLDAACLASTQPDAQQGEAVKSWEPIASAPRDRQIIRVLVPLKEGGFIEGAAYFDPDAYDGTWWWDGTSNSDYFTDPISECNHGDPLYWLPDSNTGVQASSLGIMTEQPVSVAATRSTPPSPALDAATIERVRAAADAWEAFVTARQAMNAAIPAIDATPAERALYDERYKADHEAEREHYRTACALAQVAPTLLRALPNAEKRHG